MQTHSLVPHPNHPPLAVRGIAVELRACGSGMRVTYRVDGAAKVTWPEPAAPVRCDGLWATTCFELFLMFDDDERYVEFNFSPSGEWAAYAFDGYREGMVALDRDIVPHVARVAGGVEVDCDLGGLPPGELRLGLSAVIEEAGGRRSYWALAHPAGAPDFHHAACFAARLPSGNGA